VAPWSWKRILLLFFLLLTGGLGQSLAQERCISAVDVQTKQVVETLCVGQRVRFKDCSGTLRPEVYYDYDFREKHRNFTDTTSFHAYTVPGTYVVSQFARDNQGVDASITKTYVVRPQPLTAAQLPVLQDLLLTAPGAVSFALHNLQAGYTYILEQAAAGSSTFSPVDTIRPAVPGNINHQVNDLEASATRCYRLRATGFCGGSLDVISAILCSQSGSVAAGDRQNQVTWPAYTGPDLTGYQIYRDNILLTSPPPAASAFVDGQVACGRTYCYRVVALLTGGRTSASLPACVQAISTSPPQPGFLHTTFNQDNKVVVSLRAPADETVKEVMIQRSINQASFLDLGPSGPAPFTDESFSDLSGSVCYQATFQDSCGLASAVSNRSCPVLLRIGQYDEAGVRLDWTGYEGFAGGVSQYVVELLGPNGTVVSSFPAGTATTYTDADPNSQLPVLTYRVKALSANPAELSYSNQVTLNREFRVFAPNAFTPNGDNLNDRFEVKGRFVASFRMVIYNSWGQVIFQSNDQKNSWDGRVNGQEAPAGTYAFSVEAVDGNGKKFSQTGTVTLLR
jgi:gliding motility-associated-like protein